MADDDVKALLKQVLDFLPTLATKADVAAVRTEVKAEIAASEARMSAKIDAVAAELTEHRIETRTELRVVAARLDEQRQTINAMIPTHIAALPPRSAAK